MVAFPPVSSRRDFRVIIETFLWIQYSDDLMLCIVLIRCGLIISYGGNLISGTFV